MRIDSQVMAVAARGRMASLRASLRAYLLLTKPRVVLLVSLTGMSAMILEGSLLAAPLGFLGVLTGIALAAGSASTFNQVLDRDIDAVMARTRRNRPIPAGMIDPRCAVWFGAAMGSAALLLLTLAGNGLSALIALGAIAFYVVVYTLWLKRRTSLNIVIGGVSGTAAPLIGWAAGAGRLDSVPILMALIIFLWTPPHFWALALYHREDYAAARIPMLPNVAGARATRINIAIYTLLLLPVTICFGIHAELGILFIVAALVLAINFMRHIILLWYRKDAVSARGLFLYTIIYLIVLFASMPLSKM